MSLRLGKRAPGEPIALRAGRVTVDAIPPAGWQIEAVEPGGPAGAALDVGAVARTLRAGGLDRAARGARRVSILIPDATRVARSDVYVPAVLEVLGRAGVERSGARVVLATGTHAAVGLEDRAALLGPAGEDLEVTQHDCRDAAGLSAIGRTASGNEVALSRAALDADLVVLTGRVTNHYFAGFSGGPKALLPGVAAFETVLRNHRKVLDAAGRPDPRAANGRIDENPVHREMREVAALVRVPLFLANSVVAVGEIVDFFAGPLEETHRRACSRADGLCRAPLGGTFDVVVASCGGHPGDGSLMQAIKTPIGWGPAVRDGGALVWVAGCGREGLDAFRRWLALPDAAAISAAAVRDYDLRAHNAVLLRRVAERCRLILVSPLAETDAGALGLEWAPDLGQAIAAVAEAVDPSARCLVVDQGNATYPTLPEPVDAALAA